MSGESSGLPVREVRWKQKIAIVDIQGDIDLSRSTELQHELLQLLDRKPDKIVINLAGVPYMDSSGVASLVKLLSRARKAGVGLALVGLTKRVRNIFEITRLDGVFDIRETESEATA
jgi:anti-anti-sigma factor